MDNESGFGKRLAQARQLANLTQEQLGKGLGTDGADAGKSVVYGWEKRNHYPRVEQLPLICERLNCSADWLVLGVNPAWPFSAELRKVLERLSPRDLVKMENLMRSPLEMPQLPLPPQGEHAPTAAPVDPQTFAVPTRGITRKDANRKTG